MVWIVILVEMVDGNKDQLLDNQINMEEVFKELLIKEVYLKDNKLLRLFLKNKIVKEVISWMD